MDKKWPQICTCIQCIIILIILIMFIHSYLQYCDIDHQSGGAIKVKAGSPSLITSGSFTLDEITQGIEQYYQCNDVKKDFTQKCFGNSWNLISFILEKDHPFSKLYQKRKERGRDEALTKDQIRDLLLENN